MIVPSVFLRHIQGSGEPQIMAEIMTVILFHDLKARAIERSGNRRKEKMERKEKREEEEIVKERRRKGNKME